VFLQQQSKQVLSNVFAMLRTFVIVAAISVATIPVAQAATAANAQQAVRIALQQSGNQAKVLSVKTHTTSDGKTVFLVKVLSEGRVRVVRVNRS